MIYGFARQFGGQVRIYSELGAGTTMCTYLPRHDEVADAQVDAATQSEARLVIDDEPPVRMVIAEVLEEVGYRTIEAADGLAGLKVLQSATRIDLLITDVGLPGGINGRQVADAARVVRPGLKVLFITQPRPRTPSRLRARRQGLLHRSPSADARRRHHPQQPQDRHCRPGAFLRRPQARSQHLTVPARSAIKRR